MLTFYTKNQDGILVINVIKLLNITKKYDNKNIFDKFSIEFKDKCINVISGPSGCGKTTLFNIISGIDKEFSGKTFGIPINISYLFQEDRLLPYYNVLDNILFTMPDDIKASKKVNTAKRYLKLLELENEENSFPHELSGGMSRRIAIARALSYPCDLLLLDEPFNGLNVELKHSVMKAVIKSIEIDKKTVIIITHDTQVLENYKKIYIINIPKYIE